MPLYPIPTLSVLIEGDSTTPPVITCEEPAKGAPLGTAEISWDLVVHNPRDSEMRIVRWVMETSGVVTEASGPLSTIPAGGSRTVTVTAEIDPAPTLDAEGKATGSVSGDVEV